MFSLPTADTLPTKFMRGNFRFRRVRLPQVMVKGRGGQLEEIISRYLERLESADDVIPALAGGANNRPGETRTLRLLHPLGPGHVIAADVTFRRQGENLMIRFGAMAWTWLTWLRGAIALVAYAALLPVVLGLLLYGTGVFRSWIAEYSAQHAKVDFQNFEKDKTAFYSNKITNGYYVTDCTRFRKVLDDPKAREDFDKLADRLALGSSADFGKAMQTMMNMVFSGMEENKLGFFMALGAIDDKPLALQVGLFEYFEALEPPQTQAVFKDTKPIEVKQAAFFIEQEHVLYPPLRCEHLQPEAVKKAIDRLFAPNKAMGNPKDTYPHLYAALQRTADDARQYEPPWTPARLAREDPKMGVVHLGLPGGLLAAAVGAAFAFLPPTFLRHPARWLGWPSPDQLADAGPAHIGNTFTILSETLYDDFRVQKNDVTDLAG